MSKKYTHRVAVMVNTQVIMDVEADNDLDSIKESAIQAYFDGEGDQEEGISFPTHVVIYPWREKGQETPKGTVDTEPTIVPIMGEDFPTTPDTDLIKVALGAHANMGFRNNK